MASVTVTHDGVPQATLELTLGTPTPAVRFAAITYNFSGLSLASEAGEHQIAVMQESDWAAAAQLKAAGVTTFMYQDGLFARQNDPTGITVQSQWANVDPAWKLLNAAGAWIAGKGAGDFLLDVGHPTYQPAALAHTLSLLAQHPASWSGVFLDDQNAHLAWALPGGGPYPVKYPSDAAWQAAQLSYLQTVAAGLRAKGLPVIGNIGGTSFAPKTSSPAALWASWLSHVDGALDETFGVGTDGKPTPLASWQLSLANQAWCEANGKLFLANVDSTLEGMNAYALCSLLLQAGAQSAWNTTSGRYSKFDQWFPEYDQARALGAPLGPHTVAGAIYSRRFEHGTVTVDTVAHTGAIA